jgi:hypothetical protein
MPLSTSVNFRWTIPLRGEIRWIYGKCWVLEVKETNQGKEGRKQERVQLTDIIGLNK